ncbi:MAG: hypothetical protein MUC96_01910 [Myxococcaceae bacterium]|jgi:hypothetical protein|nr:hypothetical protein [Myxococcaceae bacterium]
MKKLLVALGTLGLMACGGTAKIGGGKEGAAQAFFAASSATSAGANRSAQPLDITGSVSWKCPEGGEASLSGFGASVNTGGGGASVAQNFTVTYKNCGAARSDVGVAIYNGSFTVTQAIVTNSGNVSVDQTFKGRVEVQGAFNDFIEADVRQQVAVTGLSSSGGGVTMKLVGTIKTSSESFSYNEDINVTAGGSIAVAANTR